MSNRNLRFVVFTVAVITILIAYSILPASAQLSQWRSLNPTRDGVLPLQEPFLFSVQMLGPDYGWAVGGSCNIYAVPFVPAACVGIALFWDGVTWHNVLVPAGAGTLASVFIVSQNDVWAVGTRKNNGAGNAATIMHWDGVSWVQLPPPAASVLDLFGVFMMPGGTDGWLVGSAAAGGTNLLRWSGTWPTGALSAAAALGAPDVLRSVYLLSNTHGWIVGSAVGPPVVPTIYEWDGAGWQAVAVPPGAGALLSVYSVSLTDAWAVGAANTIIRWNGASWTGPMLAPTVGAVDYRSIRIISATDGWIAGSLNPTSNEGLLLRWNGTVWSIVRSYVTVNLNSIFLLPDGTEGAAVGDAETIIHWSGSTWFAQTSPTFFDLFAISMVTADDGWAVGEDGNIFRYDGRSWSHYETLPNAVHLYALDMRTSTDGWAVGDSPAAGYPPTILHWDGAAWTVISPSGVALGQALQAVDVVSATESWAVGTGATMLRWDGSIWASVPSGTPNVAELNGIDMLSSSDGWAVGCAALPCTNANAIIVRWNGLAWSPVTPPPNTGGLYSIFMLSPTDGWAVGATAVDGQATIIHWDGVQWSRVPAPLTGIIARGVGLNSVYMLSPTDGWAVGFSAVTGLSLIIHWDGTTWDVVSTLPVPPTMVEPLWSVFMTTPLDGWIVADEGLILHYGPESVPGTTTSYATSTSLTTVVSTITSSTTTTTSATSTTGTSVMTPASGGTWGVPGFPIESILTGLVAGLFVLTVLRRRRISRP